jgi:hypothetical protein
MQMNERPVILYKFCDISSRFRNLLYVILWHEAWKPE